MIPKIIHYCWFGGKPLTELAEKCIKSWEKYCPGYKIIEWNENNFNIDICAYVREAYDAKRWAFVADVARLYALVNYGGIYMDTDVEILKNFDTMLKYEAIAGFETENRISTGILGCEVGQRIFSEFLNQYMNIHFINEDGSYNLTTNVVKMTNICKKYGLVLNNTEQTVSGLTIFPKDYFSPKEYDSKELLITNNTYAIHYFDGSWLSIEEKKIAQLRKKIEDRYLRIFPTKLAHYLSFFISLIKIYGLSYAVKRIVKFFTKNFEKNN